MIRNFFKHKNPSVAPEAAEPEDKKTTVPEENVEEIVESLPVTIPTLGAIDHDSQIKLGIEKRFFSHIGDSLPILSTPSGEPFHGLEVKGEVFGDHEVVLQYTDTQAPVAVIERKYATAGNKFLIYSPRPAFSGEELASVCKYNQRLYHFAEVKHQEHNVMTVVFEGQTEPTYTIHTLIMHPGRHYPTRHVIKKGEDEVASTRYLENTDSNSFILVVDAGADATLMICLAVIADEVDKC